MRTQRIKRALTQSWNDTTANRFIASRAKTAQPSWTKRSDRRCLMIYERPSSQIFWAVHHSEDPPISKPSCQPVGTGVRTREPKEPAQSNGKRILQNRDNVSLEVALPLSPQQQNAVMECTRKESIEVCGSEAQDNGNSELQLKKRMAQAPRLQAPKARSNWARK